MNTHDPTDPSEHVDPSVPSSPEGNDARGTRPAPLKDEIAKDKRSGDRAGKGRLSPAVLEVRLRRIALGLLVLVPLVWWLTRALS